MDAMFNTAISASSLPVLLLIIGILIYILGKGADLLVDEAVVLSTRMGISKVLIGVTIVSLGTTVPEAAVSVFAAVKGRPEIALGNAVGSIICDTGLILGLITLFAPISLKNSVIHRQGWFQLFAGVLLVGSCIPFFGDIRVFQSGGTLPRQMGIVFLVLLAVYLWGSIRWMKDDTIDEKDDETEQAQWRVVTTVGKIVLGSGMVVISSHFLIPTVQASALRLSLPEGLISATLVAFGTSLPELVTSVTAVRKGYGELALGNIIGADILNVLFVAGASATVTSGGLEAPVHFFKLLFPAMMGTLIIFRLGIHYSGHVFKKQFSIMLLCIYAIVTVSSYLGIAA
ncbi:MAG: sodium:calcium antiporter [Desulfobacteraceae bacterium]|nr:MAG: sodium:calcium antiporter [Desulfobacteraceae bacterium]